MSTPNHTKVPRRTSADTTGEVQRVLGKLEANGLDLTINRLLANCSTSFRPFVLMSGALLKQGVLSPFLRELVILTLAAQRRLSYEWLEHVPMAYDAGLTMAQVEAIRAGSFDAAAISAEAELALRITAELTSPPSTILAEDFDAAVAAWGVDGALELALVVGWWGGFVATFVSALGLEAPDGATELPFEPSEPT